MPTPSALVGVLKSIYWKPAIRYFIDKIVVFNPVRLAENHNGTDSALQNVRYGVEFHFELTGIKSEHEDENEKKHYNIILRRLRQQKFFRDVFLGFAEYPINDLYLVQNFNLSQISAENMGEKDLGYMLYELDFIGDESPKNGDELSPKFAETAKPIYYRPKMIDGIIDVLEYKKTAVS